MSNVKEENSEKNLGSTSFVKEAATELRHTGQSLKDMMKKALKLRHNVLMVRINDDSLKKIDALVNSGIFRSRSECGAFLLAEGVKAHRNLYKKIEEKTSQIDKLKEELKNIIAKEMEEEE